MEKFKARTQHLKWFLNGQPITRNTQNESEHKSKQSKEDYWLNPSNRYAPLANDDIDDQQDTDKTPKPPPIFITGVKVISPLVQLLDTISKQQYEIKALANDEIKVQPKTTESYRTIVKALAEKNI